MAGTVESSPAGTDRGERGFARLSDAQRLRVQLEAMYRFDDRGRMLGTNEWSPGPAPRFHLLRAPEACRALVHRDLPTHLAARLLEFAAQEPLNRPLEAPPAFRLEYLDLLGADEFTGVWAGPNYFFPDGFFRDGFRRGRSAVSIEPGQAALLEPTLREWIPDVPHARPFVAVLVGGRAVAVCASVRRSVAVHEAGVETDPAARGCGHAVDAVAGWAARVRAAGAAPLYSTSWNNRASRRVAEKLGLEIYGATFHVS